MDGSQQNDPVVVPDVVGLTVAEGRRIAEAAGVALAQPDADGPPLAALTWPGVWLITDQDPTAGTTVRRWDSVRVRFGEVTGDGLSGVREPHRPAPDPDGLTASRACPEADG